MTEIPDRRVPGGSPEMCRCLICFPRASWVG